MFKYRIPFIFLLVVAISGCTDEESASVKNITMNQSQVSVTVTQGFAVTEPSTVYVEIIGSKFNPPELRIVSGTTVRWKNSDNAVYVIRVDNSTSPNLSGRDTWNYTFNRTGTFEYNCSLHSKIPGGRIIVEATGK